MNYYEQHTRESGNAIVIGVILLAVLIIGGYMLIPDKDDSMHEDDVAMMDGTAPAPADAAMEAVPGNAMVAGEADAMMEAEPADAMEGDAMHGAMAGTYEDYAPEKLSWAKGENKVVLFFHATWCPTCRATDKAITSAASLPENLTILKTDYDSNTELKKKYGVTTQHTFVQVDAQGNMIKKWSSSPTAADIAAHVM